MLSLPGLWGVGVVYAAPLRHCLLGGHSYGRIVYITPQEWVW
jgi:hypothetical protein